MTGMPRKIVLSGDLLLYCVCSCLQDLFDDERYDELAAQLDAEDETEIDCQPQTREGQEELARMFQLAMRKPWLKRPAWVASCSKEYQYYAFVALFLCTDKIDPAGKYQVSPRWTSSLVQAIRGVAWPSVRRRDMDARLPGLVYTRGYLACIAQGGHPYFARWIVCY